ncbi:unnamed protein product [Urochloa decumbens]|uniref:F-box domain-containing protein n=1 Tax=Urochloa decumbens TaxID=240449 RepID=A0ABC9BRV7_9POAL
MAADSEGFNLPTDALVEILLRLPTSARRRFRLVCKQWRDLVDERTPERQVRTKILAFIRHGSRSHAIVFDDKDGRRMHEWCCEPATHGFVDIIGTCNGLICLHDTGDSDCSVITVTNPVTGEAAALPPAPASWDSPRHQGLYAFGYHPTTGRYKVVHVPRRLVLKGDKVHVFTLGGGGPSATWREVVSPAMDGCYHNSFCGIVSVDGSVYWFTSRADRVVALDLGDDERVTLFQGPPGVRPVERVGEASWKVTSVHARLGVAVPRYEAETTTVEVWVLDGGGEPPRWSRWYCLSDSARIVMTPHLTHGEYVLSTALDKKRTMTPRLIHGEYVLTASLEKKRLYRRKVAGGDGRAAPMRPSEGAELIMSEVPEGRLMTFAYAETREPVPTGRVSSLRLHYYCTDQHFL